MNVTGHVDWWLRYDASGASSRYRAFQYFDLLVADGWVSTTRPLAPFEGGTPLRQAAGVAKRLYDLARPTKLAGSNVTVAQKELLVPAALGTRRLVRRLPRPLVWDVDDAVWELNRGRRCQSRYLVETADAVVAGSPVLADWCAGMGARRVELIPTCTSVPEQLPTKVAEETVIAWVGSRFTAPFLDEVGAVVREILDGPIPCRFESMGGSLPSVLSGHPRAATRAWSPEAERELLARADIGVAPTPRTPFADGKCGFKVVQYAAHGMAVVATDSPTHRHLLGVEGALAKSEDDWRRILRAYVHDGALCAETGRANWGRARTMLSTEVGAAQWSKVLADVQ